LGHPNNNLLQELAIGKAVEGVNISKSPARSFCEKCLEGKMHRKPFREHLISSHFYQDVIHFERE
jgi:hypothetical protein